MWDMKKQAIFDHYLKLVNDEIIYERHTITWSHQKSKTRIEIDVRGC